MQRFVAAIALVLALTLQATAVTIEDSRGAQTFDRPPERIVALNWALLELVLKLDAAPVAAADVKGYGAWVVRPPLPESVVDVGARREPNLELLSQLKPDLILVSDDQREMIPRLSAIAPVLHFNLFSAEHDNLAASRHAYLELAKLLGKTQLGTDRLAQLDAKIADLRRRLVERFEGRPPKVTPIRFLDQARVRVHGENSAAQFALEGLGLSHGFPQPRTAWGFTLKKVEDLGRVDEGFVIHIEPFLQADKLFKTPLWSFMPFVKAGRFTSIPPTWTFGGPFSVGHLAEAVADALMEVRR